MFRRFWLFFVVLALPWLFAGCARLPPPGPAQPLVVGLPASPLFQGQADPNEGMEGFSRDLGGLFAARLGFELRFVVAANDERLRELVRKGRVHFAAGMPVMENDPHLHFTQALRTTRQVVVQHADTLPLRGVAGLAGREVSVLPGAPQIASLQALGLDPPPVPVVRESVDEIELLSRVARLQEMAATDDLHFSVAANFYPEIMIAAELPAKVEHAWAFAPRFESLRVQADDFFEALRADGTLRRLEDRYFGHIGRISQRDMSIFLVRIRTHLPHFRLLFHHAQVQTGIDWRLLAALAYQESKWDPLATSPTGVRGLMMLTEDTADRMGVSNRLDPAQSISAGSRYLALLMDELPPEVQMPDRLWLALAAYNLGMGHLRGGRHFAPGLGRDPNSWADMKRVLPLLARPEYYRRLKSGRARGGQAVILVENVRNYYDVLSRFEPPYLPVGISRDGG